VIIKKLTWFNVKSCVNQMSFDRAYRLPLTLYFNPIWMTVDL